MVTFSSYSLKNHGILILVKVPIDIWPIVEL